MLYLLSRAEGAILAAKAWAPKRALQQLRETLAATRQWAETAVAAAGPGQAHPLAAMPPANVRASRAAIGATEFCAGCGAGSLSLRKCSGCRAVAYCSRECQVRHWLQGGHKRECAELATAAAARQGATGGGATTRACT